ncbi:hypothetical protein DMN34_12865, partial [Clostridium perfringens]
YPLMGNNIYFNKKNISLKETKFTTDIKYENSKLFKNCIKLHKTSKLSIISNYFINIYDFL